MSENTPRTPTGLGTSGKRLWKRIIGEYELAAHEAHILESACREADMITRLEEAAKEAPLTVKGSMGQEVASPLITELRQHRTTQANLLKALRLPDHPAADEDPDDELAVKRGSMSRSEAGSKGARVRWGREGA